MKKWLREQKKNVDLYLIRPRRIALAYAFVIFIGLFAFWLYIGTLIETRLTYDERKQVATQVNTIGTSLTLAVNQRLMLITSVRSYMEAKVRRDNDFSFENRDDSNEVNYFSSVLQNSAAGIRNIAIAPGGVMQYVYPYEENKAVLGYEPAWDERPNVREEVRRAVETGEIILSLPYELIQGGQGLIARQAIYINGTYWGLANVVLDVPPLLQEAGISPVPAGLNLALKDQSGRVFSGSEDVFQLNPVVYDVELPEGLWKLAGVPSVGWQAGYQATMRFYHAMGLTGIFAISVVVYQLINRRERLANLVDRRTHELALSNQTLITVLEGIDADVYVSDFETNEILFANRHLRETFNDDLVGKICYEIFRDESSVCAHCTNHLLLDADDNPTGVHLWEARNPIAKRWYKNADRAIRWHDGRYVHLQIATDITEQRQAVDAIRESEERYRSLFNSVPVGIYRSTPDGRFLDGNPALIDILGYPDHETMMTANIKDLYIDESSREHELALIEQGDFVSNYRMRLRRYDGVDIWVQDSANAVRDNSGQTVHYYGRLEDITEQVRAEEEIRAYQERFKVFFNSVNDAIFVHPLVETGFAPFIEVNGIACRRYGYSREEFLKLTAIDITLETDVEEYSAPNNRKKLLKARHLVFESVHVKKSGEEFPVEINANIVEEHGQPVILSVVRDITERKRSGQALREREAKLQSIIRAAPVGIGMVIDRVLQEANQMLCQITGYDRDELIGQNARILYPSAEDYEYVGNEKYRMIKEMGIGTVETHWKCKSGEIRDVLLSSVPLDPNDLSKGVTFTALDITERKQTENAIQESERRYRSIVESSPLGMHMYVLEFPEKLIFSGSNPAADEILGVDNSMFIGKTIEEAFPQLVDTEVPERYKLAAEKGRPWKTDQIDYDADGIKGAFEVVAFQTSQNKMVAMFHNITARKQAEEALRMKTAELESLFSISSHLREAQSADAMLSLVLEEMRRVLRSDANAIILLDADEKHFTYALSDGPLTVNDGMQFSVEKSISGLVLQTRQPYITEDLSSDSKKTTSLQGDSNLGPAVVVPMISESEFLGVLLCARNKGGTSAFYSSSEVQLLTAIGEMVGNALRRVRLYDQALTRLQHVQTLHSIDMAISANLDLSVILDVLLTQGLAQLDADAASILLLNPNTHMLEFAAGNGFRTKEIKSTRLHLGEGLPKQVVVDRGVLHIPNLSDSNNLVRKYLLEEGFVSYLAVPLIAKGQLQGVLEIFNRKPMVEDDEQRGFLETLATQAAIAIENSQLFSDLQRSNFELEMAYDATIEGWSRALELRDQDTEGHTLRVTDMTLQLAQLMGVKSRELIHIRRGALLHDIGKMGVPDRILLKPGKLIDEEWKIMKQHTVYAYEMLWPIEFLRPALDIPHCHHEHWDGTGYPRQLKGEQIPLSARLFAVADVWDALTSDRPYRKAWAEEKARDYIAKNTSTHFDPRAVELFMQLRAQNG